MDRQKRGSAVAGSIRKSMGGGEGEDLQRELQARALQRLLRQSDSQENSGVDPFEENLKQEIKGKRDQYLKDEQKQMPEANGDDLSAHVQYYKDLKDNEYAESTQRMLPNPEQMPVDPEAQLEDPEAKKARIQAALAEYMPANPRRFKNSLPGR